MRHYYSYLVLLMIAGVFCSSCERKYLSYYAPPDDLAGPIYEQLMAEEELSTFVQAIDLIDEGKPESEKLSRIMSTSGLYTVFAPDNAAWDKYFSDNGYSALNEVPKEQLANLVEYHILFSMYYWYDFEKGIRDFTTTTFDDFKYQSRARQPIARLSSEEGSIDLSDGGPALDGDQVNVFFDYLSAGVYALPYLLKEGIAEDYNKLYQRAWNGERPMFDGAEVISEAIDAKNGVIHIIDEVSEPTGLAYNYMEETAEVSEFLGMAKSFMRLNYLNTTSQESGQDLYNLNFVHPNGVAPSTSNVWGSPKSQWTGTLGFADPNSEVTLIVPTNDKLVDFLTTGERPWVQNFTAANELPILGQYYFVAGATRRSSTQSLWPSQLLGQNTKTGDSIHANTILANPLLKIVPTANGVIYQGDLMPSTKLRSVTALCLLDTDYEWTGHAITRISPEEEKGVGSNGKAIMDLLSEPSEDLSGKFTFLTPNNAAWTNYGFTSSDNFTFEAPEGSIMNNITSTKFWMTIKTHALLGELDQTAIENGTLANGYYPSASRLYVKYTDGQFLGYNRDVNKVNSYIPNMCEVIAGSARQTENGTVVGIDGIIDYDMNFDFSLEKLAKEDKLSAGGPGIYQAFFDKCEEVKLFNDGEIDYLDARKVQNMTVFALTQRAITEYQAVIDTAYNHLPNKDELDETAYKNRVWREVLKGHFAWDANNSYKRLYVDNATFTGDGNYEKESISYYLNTPISVEYDGADAYISRPDVTKRVKIGVAVDGTDLGTADASPFNRQCINAVVHLVDEVLPIVE